MNKTLLNVIIRDTVAMLAPAQPLLICGNDKYRIRFSFDEEWADHDAKVARFLSKGEYIDVEFKGNEVDVPLQRNTFELKVGVYTDGGPFTTTSAVVPCKPSVLCENAEPSLENDGRYLNEARELIKEAREMLAENISLVLGQARRAATIHVAELPTENIREDCFYKILGHAETYLLNADGIVANDYNGILLKVHVVDELPPSGEPFVDDSQPNAPRLVAYFCTADREAYVWLPKDDYFDHWSWVPLSGIIGSIEEGTRWQEINSTEEVTERGVLYILVPRAEKGLFHYNGEWLELVSKARA